MACRVCKEMTRDGSDAVDQSLENFIRFYGRYLNDEHKNSQHDSHEYQYEELKDKDYTRLLELLPGNDHEDITCLLVEAPINNPLRYSALSYTWGATARTKAVLVNDQSFQVGELTILEIVGIDNLRR